MSNYEISKLKNEQLHKFQVFTSCDMSYFNNYAEKLLISINLNSPGTKVILHIVNPDDEFDIKIEKLRKRLKSTDIVTIKESVDLSSLSQEEKITYYAVYRFVAFAKYFEECRKDTYFTDIDAYIKKDLFLLRRPYEHADIAVHLRMNLQYQRGILTGSLFFKASDIVSKFVEEMKRTYLKRGIAGIWMLDQVVFWELLAKYSSKLKVVNLDRKFVEHKMLDDAPIWTAKGDKKESPKFIKYGEKLIANFKTEKDICILAPRIDHAFKDTIKIDYSEMYKRERETVRIYWLYFAKILHHFISEKGYNVEIIMRPAWEFTEDFIKNLPHKHIYVPHKSFHQIQDERCIFYMQELYNNFFTLDNKGWAASSSKYKNYKYINESVNNDTLDFIKNIKKNKISKYEQGNNSESWEFDVFFPLQIPHDQTILYHSKYEYKEILETIVKWATKNKVRILFKKHPYDNKLKYFDWSLAKNNEYIKFTNKGNIHDYIKRAKVVFVANSGVGFEALFYYKPVITFARAIYDMVSFNCDIKDDDITKIYQKALDYNPNTYKEECNKFIQWYIFKEGIDISKKYINIDFEIDVVENGKNIFLQDINDLINAKDAEMVNEIIIERAKKDWLIGVRGIIKKLAKVVYRHKWD